MGSNPKLPHQPTSERVSEDHSITPPFAAHISRDMKMFGFARAADLILPSQYFQNPHQKHSVCLCSEKGHGQAWIRESPWKLSGSWAVGCCGQPQRQGVLRSSLGAVRDLWLAEAQGCGRSRAEPICQGQPKYTYKYIHINIYRKE